MQLLNINDNDNRDVWTRTFWRPRLQILRPRPLAEESVDKRPHAHMSVNVVRDTDVKYYRSVMRG